MFTGIIQAIGAVRAITPKDGGVQLTIEAGTLDLKNTAIGDSICVSGCCLTATHIDGSSFTADVSRATLEVTTLGRWRAGTRVNLEKALGAGQPLGGHFVSGHVDGVARVVASEEDGHSRRLTLEAPTELARYIARKGSVTVDGVSLTVNEVDVNRFTVNLIPHTLAVTTLGECRIGCLVNLEVDIIARYLERLLDQSNEQKVTR
ncbi:MAG: riboflavin synthase [Gammaproteobacteria bacterium]|nr:riboflavin synthase [Gammaproteobacteria bacterium]